MNRKLPYDVRLPILYHILDLIGSDRVERYEQLSVITENNYFFYIC